MYPRELLLLACTSSRAYQYANASDSAICGKVINCQSRSATNWITVVAIMEAAIVINAVLAKKDGRFIITATISGSPSCSLPESWSGKWFEHGERDAVEIFNSEGGGGDRGSSRSSSSAPTSTISHKGECVARKGDKYVFKDR